MTLHNSTVPFCQVLRFIYCCSKCRYAEFRYAECHYAGRLGALNKDS